MKSLQVKKAGVKAIVLGAVLLSSLGAYADEDKGAAIDTYLDTCKNLPLVDTLLTGIANTDVCVDAPVGLTKAKAVFDMTTDHVDAKGRHVGLRHMMMLAMALKQRIDNGVLDPEEVSIIGVMHGTGLNMALKDAVSTVNKGIINKIFELKAAGVNINLEVCGVTMHGAGYKNDDLYVGPNGDKIHVNQGAIGRLIDLEQHKYALVKESD